MPETLDVFFGDKPRRAEDSWAPEIEWIYSNGERSHFAVKVDKSADGRFTEANWFLRQADGSMSPKSSVQISYRYKDNLLASAFIRYGDNAACEGFELLPRRTTNDTLYFWWLQYEGVAVKSWALYEATPKFDEKGIIANAIFRDVHNPANSRSYYLLKNYSGEIIKEVCLVGDEIHAEYYCGSDGRVFKIVQGKKS